MLFGPTRRRVPKMIDLTNPVLLGPVQNQEHYMQGVVARRDNFVEPILDFFEAAYKDFAALTGRYYGLVSQYKSEDADTVFVSLGSAAENIEAAVDYLRERENAKRRLDPHQRLPPVPGSGHRQGARRARRTSSSSSAPTSRWRATTRWAATSARRSTRRCRAKTGLPKITAGRRCRGSSPASTAWARATSGPSTRSARTSSPPAARARKDGKRAADGASFIVLGVDHPYEVKSDDTPSLLPDRAIAVRFHSVGGWGAITTGKNLGAIIGDLNDLLYERDKVVDEFGNPKEIIHVSANPKYGSEKKGAPTSYFMVAAPERIRVNCDLRHVNVVLCCDPKAFTHTNPLDGMSEGGCLVWESDEEGEQAWERLPLWARKQIIDKKIRVFTLPGFEIAREGDRPRRPAAAHAGQRVPRRVLLGLAAAAGIRHHARSSSATSSTSST